MTEYVITCKCGDTDKFVKDAFKILFPEQDFPTLVSGRIAVKDLSRRLSDGPLNEYLQAIIRSDDKFAYYAKVDGDELELWNLLEGKRIC